MSVKNKNYIAFVLMGIALLAFVYGIISSYNRVEAKVLAVEVRASNHEKKDEEHDQSDRAIRKDQRKTLSVVNQINSRQGIIMYKLGIPAEVVNGHD
tara:strand:- start:2411 stop:2701 length:291 start_codon:yes stop_codon:yes gene_type:complete